jgi:hypothetical protein
MAPDEFDALVAENVAAAQRDPATFRSKLIRLGSRCFVRCCLVLVDRIGRTASSSRGVNPGVSRRHGPGAPRAVGRERGWTKSRAIRLAVRTLTRPAASDPILELSGMFEGLPADLSENFDRHLNQTYVAEHAPAYGVRRSRAKSRLRR